MTTNNPAHGPVSLDRLHQISEILSKAAVQSDGGNLGYAMADAVKVIDDLLAIPETLPCPVFLEPGLKFGKGVPTRFVLAALRRRADYYAELEAMTPEQRAEHDAGIVEFKAMLGASKRDSFKMPEELLSAMEEVLRISDRDHEAWHKVRNGITSCRAAMLHGADGKPELTVWYGAMPETNGKTNWTAMLHRKGHHPWEGITIDRSEYPDRVRYEADRMRHLIGELTDEPDILSYDADAHSGYVNPGNSPVTPDGWIPVSERMPERDVDVQVYCADKKEQMVAYMERNEADGWFRFASLPNGGGVYCKPTHWMPLPAAPHFREISNSSTNNFRENAETSTKCWCHTCRPVTMSDMRFVVCPDCGNKRCPHANDHRNACTGSNEPGQIGSAYPAAPQQEVK